MFLDPLFQNKTLRDATLLTLCGAAAAFTFMKPAREIIESCDGCSEEATRPVHKVFTGAEAGTLTA